jgi:hypothetical protein
MKTGSLYITIVAAVVIVLAALPALADYHYASHSGSNTPPYSSWATAADSIQKAIDAATAGDTIYVGAGVWSERDSIDFYKAIIGKGIDSTIYYQEGFGGPFLLLAYSGTLTEGFTFRGDNNGMGGGFSGDAFDSLITIKNCKFINLEAGVTGSYSGTIENCIFEHNSWCGACLDIVRSFDMVIKNNTFIDDSLYHLGVYNGRHIITNNLFVGGYDDMIRINLYNVIGDSAFFANNIIYNIDTSAFATMAIAAGGHLRAINNTILGTKGIPGRNYDGIYIGRHPDDIINFYFENNVISGFNRATFIVYETDTFDVTYDDYWRNATNFRTYGAAVDTTGIIHADPMLADTNTFQLQMFSPLINAGDPTILDEDGSRSDIGAWGGPYGHSYQYIDYPPQIPTNLHGQLSGDTIKLNWKYNTEADFSHYSLYRDTMSGFTPSGLNLLAEPETSFYADLDFETNHTYYYKLSATDNQNNISDYSVELLVYVSSIDGNDNLPVLSSLGIKNTFPNPFNSSMMIEYYLPDVGFQPAPVQVNVYDIQGSIVKHLVDTRQYPGNHEILWDGRNDDKKEVNSGVYFVRLVFSGIELAKPKKITLIR